MRRHYPVDQDDSLTVERKVLKKHKQRVDDDSERFRFEGKGKPLDVRFSYFWSWRISGKPNRVSTVTLIFNHFVNRKQMEEVIRNGLEYIQIQKEKEKRRRT